MKNVAENFICEGVIYMSDGDEILTLMSVDALSRTLYFILIRRICSQRERLKRHIHTK